MRCPRDNKLDKAFYSANFQLRVRPGIRNAGPQNNRSAITKGDAFRFGGFAECSPHTRTRERHVRGAQRPPASRTRKVFPRIPISLSLSDSFSGRLPVTCGNPTTFPVSGSKAGPFPAQRRFFVKNEKRRGQFRPAFALFVKRVQTCGRLVPGTYANHSAGQVAARDVQTG